MRKNIFIVIVLVLIIFTGSLFFREKASAPNPLMNEEEGEKVTFTTADGVEIAGNFYPQPGNVLRRTVLFLHMMPATKESWDSLAKELQKRDVASLAIDLRGHGESVKVKRKNEKGKNLDYRNFSDEEHQTSELDVEAALAWLNKKNGGLPISIVGASIGANFALEALARHNLPRAAVLSPGLNYRGIEPLGTVKKLKDYPSVLYVSAKDDRDGRNAKETQELFNATTSKKQIKLYDKGGHGTDMLAGTDLLPVLVEFLTSEKDLTLNA